MRNMTLFAIMAAVLLSAVVVTAGEDKVACSVCGYLADGAEGLDAEYEGVRYHFCSPGCRAYFDKDPKAVAAGMDVDAVCGMTVSKDKAVVTAHNNRRLYFCSEACRDKYLASPGEYEMNYDYVGGKVMRQKDMKHSSTFEGMPLYFESAENKVAFDKDPGAYVHDMCPVTGKVFLRKEAGAKLERDGKTYYFCCESCMKKFKADPKKYLGKARGAAYEKCGDAKSGSLGCKEAAKGEEGCRKAIEAGECPHAKDKPAKK